MKNDFGQRMSETLFRFVALVIICVGFVRPAFAEGTNAVIPYEKLDELCQIVSGIDQSKLLVRVSVSCLNKAVHPSDISLNIQSVTKGIIPVLLSTNGEILNFPHENELVRENPPVLSNQPKGTLNLNVGMKIAIPEDTLKFPYTKLSDGVAEANKAIKAQAGMVLSWFAPKAQGVIIWFPKESAGKAKVTISSSRNGKEFVADAKGQVKLVMEKSLLEENPEVRLSEKALAIFPDIE